MTAPNFPAQTVRLILSDLHAIEWRLHELKRTPGIGRHLDNAIGDSAGLFQEIRDLLRNAITKDAQEAEDADRPTRDEWRKEHAYP